MQKITPPVRWIEEVKQIYLCWEHYCFNSVYKFGSLQSSFATINSVNELYFRFRRFKMEKREKSDFYELWQQHKLLKTMEIIEIWPDTDGEGYIHQFQPEPNPKIH